MVSIITVNYNVRKQLLASIDSIIKSKPKNSYEIIVVDNSRDKELKSELAKNYNSIKYISNENTGFGAGNNIGVEKALGDLLFFLNPDTIVYENTIDNLVDFYQKDKNIGIAAPLLLGQNGTPYQQGSRALTPFKALFVLSFINKIFPNNPVSAKYFLNDWDKMKLREVDVAPGTAFLISKKLFSALDGFDNKFFLFFEEFDFCRRLKKAGYKICIFPDAKILHLWGESTKQNKNIMKIFRASRFYYFRKHFGIAQAIMVETFLRLNKIVLISIVAIVALFTLLILYLVK